MEILKTVRNIMYADRYVSAQRADAEHRNQRGIALIAIAAFMVMSLLNIKQKSYVMLGTTGISAILLMIGYLISKYKDKSAFLRICFYIIFIVIFTSYTIMGGNEGFAALWLIIATYAVMIAIDFKAGFVISTYYLLMLLLVFDGPLSFMLQFDYNKTFILRFPFLYAINFAFATYIIIRIRTYQFELLIKQEELEQLSLMDLSTGLMNRNYYIQYEQSFQAGDINTLLAVYIDVNGLHEINNRDGHDAGDKMLYFVADLCKQYFCGHSIFRMGGDEFLIICKDAQESKVRAVAEKLLESVEQEGFSISYGIEKQTDDFDLKVLVKNADSKMIQCKKAYYKDAGRGER